MTLAPKRRWFRWSLLIVFSIMGALAYWLGYNLYWIRQRHEALINGKVEIPRLPTGATRSSPPPTPLGAFGEKGYGDLLFRITSEYGELSQDERPEYVRMKQFFPEARFWLASRSNPVVPANSPVTPSPRVYRSEE